MSSQEQVPQPIRLPDGRYYNFGHGDAQAVGWPPTPAAHAAEEAVYREGYTAGLGGHDQSSTPYYPIMPRSTGDAERERFERRKRQRDAWDAGWVVGEADRKYIDAALDARRRARPDVSSVSSAAEAGDAGDVG